MAYIYKITNLINGKSYIGKTGRTIEQRWDEHKREIYKHYNRPLYAAMRKYGIDNFQIEQIEECKEEVASDREIYWIKYYNTYGNTGYNATRGGDSKFYIERQPVIDKYKEIGTIKGTAKELGIDRDTVRKILREYNIEPTNSIEYIRKTFGKKVNQYDLEGNYIQTFDCLREAERWLNKPKAHNHISEVCRGKRQTAYGYKWKFAE